MGLIWPLTFPTGLGLNYGQKMWNVGLLVTNGRGADAGPFDDELTMAVTVDIDPLDDLHIDLNYMTGKESFDYLLKMTTNNNSEVKTETILEKYDHWVSIIDASISYTINKMFNVAVNYISNTVAPHVKGNDSKIESTSLAGYINARYDRFNFGLRYESFKSELTGHKLFAYNGYIPRLGIGNENSVNSITFATGMEMAENTSLLLEYRMDKAEGGVWLKNIDDHQKD